MGRWEYLWAVQIGRASEHRCENIYLPAGDLLWYFSMATEETIFRGTEPLSLNRKTNPASERT